MTARPGVESAHGFGDALFNLPLIRAIGDYYNNKVAVAVRPHCRDAFVNVPFVAEIVEIDQLHRGGQILPALGYSPVFQITQNLKFFEFRDGDEGHSLIHTPTRTGQQLGLSPFEPRPLFFPTAAERAAAEELRQQGPLIAVESVFTSGQSWADQVAIDRIVSWSQERGTVLWLSHYGHPPRTLGHGYTRRELICALPHCRYFFSVGSGFFCASLAAGHQPAHTICLWLDHFYHYEQPVTAAGWSKITWVHTHQELEQVLCTI